MSGFSQDKKMQRSVSQAMYRYLPQRWVDFYIKSSRDSYSAYVTNWNSEKLEDANTDRIIREVWHRLDGLHGLTDGFAPTGDASAWSVLTPKSGDKNSSIFTEVSPLLFFCSNPKCRKATSFYSSNAFLSNYNANKRCKYCQSPMTQVRMIYYCNCGWAAPVTLPKCQCGGAMFQKSTYIYECSKCHSQFELRTKCKKCGKLVYPRNALDNAHYYGHSFSLIDLVNMEQEKFISEQPEGRYLTIAYWMNLITREQFQQSVKYYLQGGGQQIDEDQLQVQIEEYKKILPPGFPEEQIRALALKAVEMNDPLKDARSAVEKAKILVPQQSDIPEIARNAAMKILEYDTVLYADERISIDEAANTALELQEIDDVRKYHIAKTRGHFSTIQTSSKVPFVMAVYGYSRKDNEIKGDTKLCAFTKEKNARSNIYATRMETEGVLFELDRREVLRWMQRNGWISNIEYNDAMPEEEIKAWFLNNCDESKISYYGSVDEAKEDRFYRVFKLLHSISHALLRQAATITGLDKSSLAEYIFSDVPAVFIYCQNSQGFNLGAMQSAMESQLDYWINGAISESYQCIFDPVCKDETGACAGCLFLNDVSCHYFNRQLDRRYLIGYTDNEGKHTYGFWEE